MMNWKFWQRRTEPMPAPGDPDWERALINRVALEYLGDQRRGRRWGNIFKLLILLYLIGILAVALSRSAWEGLKTGKEHTALVQVKGVISADSEASADRVISALRDAFEAPRVKGVILRINSPGGSPVQSGYINNEVRRLKEKYKRTRAMTCRSMPWPWTSAPPAPITSRSPPTRSMPIRRAWWAPSACASMPSASSKP